MNGNHLPAGQPGGGVGGGGVVRGQVDMGPGTGPTGGRQRRPPPPQYQPHHQMQHQYYHHQQHVNPIYHNGYIAPYAQSYYQAPHHYQNGVIANTPYMQYNSYSQRSPPAIHQQYAPIVSSNMQSQHQPYPRPPPQQPQQQHQHQQPSPALSTPPPYVAAAPPPPPPPPVSVPETPSSTHSSQALPAPLTPPTPQTQEVASTTPDVELRSQLPFRPPLPWLSRPDIPFPTKSTRSKRRRRIQIPNAESVELPSNQGKGLESGIVSHEGVSGGDTSLPATPTLKSAAATGINSTSTDLSTQSETPSTQDVPSEIAHSTSPSTPQSVYAVQSPTATSITPTKTTKPASRTAVPAVPVVPVMPKASSKEATSSSAETKTSEEKQSLPEATAEAPATESSPEDSQVEVKPESTPAPVKAAPKLWTGLFARSAPNPSSTGAPGTGSAVTGATTTGAVPDGTVQSNGSVSVGSFAKSNASSLAEALRAYSVSGDRKIAFLEPRGLINTGNMCYMNSVLQVLIFCIPFYDFLDQVGKKAAHSFKSETPLIDAMIMFMREYKVIDSAVSVEQLRRRLKNEELEQYGEPFTPEFVYDAIRKLPRFSSMRRGHQQDAEEFLGFLLEALHDECAQVMRHLPNSAGNSTAGSPSATSPTSTPDTNDWLEVGRRQRAAITRSSGHPIALSPISKVFGGQLRSELRVSGLQDSVTLEPFQPLQLDIGSPQVHNIVDALKGLTTPETLHGDFGSSRGKDAVAVKQVFIESLPPVLILHLKRFQFDTEGTGTVKIWKKIGYPLELELPKEIFSRQKRNSFLAEGQGFPKYRLIAVVYHHGKNASGGHYTVDLRRQDSREWIRLDDTVIRRVRSEDVAEGGAEDDRVKTSTRPDKKDTAVGGSGNRFEGIGDNEAGDDEGWNKVSAPTNGAKKWSSVVNGAPNTTTQTKGKQAKENIKDNKVAYLLFYQRV
ncbi:cysteine proteinase [Annulohypoxylon maeteangense]|uniref:cysteine proteinase n=1 Tax=Annulohypoxylon maeteangense TaxID=1927788 RepID=UPI002008C282|nr:cysteine proteinase [Annulohypoxylon maeteangense]KAI0881793.1 cysteine proteinase [Annulohypoxylon maeteangense]